ncbi:MAG: hypothetical protein M0014_08850 [Actinomycetota bacterium]|jgi:hypothetical protein|nr:hypothetical protein [Actinomycetota bacterium]
MRAAFDFSRDAGSSPPHLVRRYGEDPGPGFTAIPYTDTNSAGLIDEAVRSLVVLRAGSGRDPGAALSVLVSLAAEVQARVPDAVWLARARHGYSWGQVAERLGIATESARRRYSDYVRARSDTLS